ncbi:hypothetical protein F53441_8765 [Fusarium austroafricanum]|uniref:Uncharacterized protein n=1 Tax=Fusarium austroafricanum TaxID=2364996 RepID=A0A8H4KD99_9HYPO|nr:hypothetical protein F53441_8765 [Fusarium austroafricanum]
MRLSWARLAAITGLVAIAIADVLPPDDIPLMCVTICGPIVELTAKCDVHNHRRLAKRQPSPEWVPKLAVEPPEGDELHKRSFSIIRAAPTSFPPQFTPEKSTPTSTTRSAPQDPSAAEKSVTMRQKTMTTSSLSTPSTVQPTKSTMMLGESATMSRTSWEASMRTQSLAPVAEDDPERECVCKNTSFDVAKIAALCQDCIVVDGHKQNNLDVIMQACGFEELTYTPDKDSLADNIRVEATRPTAMGAKQDSTTNAGAGMESIKHSLIEDLFTEDTLASLVANRIAIFVHGEAE